jgi:hypothetical protein
MKKFFTFIMVVLALSFTSESFASLLRYPPPLQVGKNYWNPLDPPTVIETATIEYIPEYGEPGEPGQFDFVNWDFTHATSDSHPQPGENTSLSSSITGWLRVLPGAPPHGVYKLTVTAIISREHVWMGTGNPTIQTDGSWLIFANQACLPNGGRGSPIIATEADLYVSGPAQGQGPSIGIIQPDDLPVWSWPGWNRAQQYSGGAHFNWGPLQIGSTLCTITTKAIMTIEARGNGMVGWSAYSGVNQLYSEKHLQGAY